MPRRARGRGIEPRQHAPADRRACRDRALGAGHDLDQRRLAGAVLADQRVDFARAKIERDAVERADAGERLGDGLSGEQDGVHGRPDDHGWCRHRQGAKSGGMPGRDAGMPPVVGQIGKYLRRDALTN